MTRVVFVDDEALVLQGLRRALIGLVPGCRMAFADGADAAVVLLEAEPADIVVSDMRMPGRDGASLLEEVRSRWPSTIRLLLTGQIGEDAVRAVGVAHQVLAKPIDTDVLAATVRRLLDSAASGDGSDAAVLAAEALELPSRPGTFDRFAGLVAEGAPAREVAMAIEADVAVSGRVLQLVNSAFFALPRRISDIGTAVTYLGNRTLQVLILSVELERSLSGKVPAGFPLEEIGEYSAQVAVRARTLAVPVQSDTAFASGLLHDIGLLALAASRPDAVQAHLAAAGTDVPLSQVEYDDWGFTHAQAGRSLLTLWGLPEEVAVAVSLHHHEPLDPRAGPAGLDAVTAVQVALTAGPPGPFRC